jgi:hypothetical protein
MPCRWRSSPTQRKACQVKWPNHMWTDTMLNMLSSQSSHVLIVLTVDNVIILYFLWFSIFWWICLTMFSNWNRTKCNPNKSKLFQMIICFVRKLPKCPSSYVRLVWPVPLAQVLPPPQLIFPSKNLVFGNLFEFSAAEIT